MGIIYIKTSNRPFTYQIDSIKDKFEEGQIGVAFTIDANTKILIPWHRIIELKIYTGDK